MYWLLTPADGTKGTMSLDRVAHLVGVCLLTLLPPALSAQVTEFTIPPNSILPNYDRVSIGQREALEGGAYVARTDDALANWYNPAGLVQSEKTALNASSNAYELTKTTLSGIGQKSSGTRFSPVGGFFGIVVGEPVAKNPRVRLGFGYTKPVAWSTQRAGRLVQPAGRHRDRRVRLYHVVEPRHGHPELERSISSVADGTGGGRPRLCHDRP